MSERETLTDFLLDRIAEDEAVALAVLSDYAQHAAEWDCPSTGVLDIGDPDLDGMVPLGDGRLAAHIARHDPARVLADCEARRQIIDRCRRVLDSSYGADLGWTDVSRRERYHASVTLELLALPYADHPDYREEWRP